jgi:hypothetical protein
MTFSDKESYLFFLCKMDKLHTGFVVRTFRLEILKVLPQFSSLERKLEEN